MAEPLRIIISSTSLQMEQEAQSIAQFLFSRRPATLIQIIGIAQLPNIIANLTPPPCDLMVLITRGAPPNRYLVEDLGNLAKAGCTVVGYPKPISNEIALFKAASNEEELLRIAMHCHSLAYKPDTPQTDIYQTENLRGQPVRSTSLPAHESSLSSRQASFKRSEASNFNDGKGIKKDLQASSHAQSQNSHAYSKKGSTAQVKNPSSMRQYYPAPSQIREADRLMMPPRPMSVASDRSAGGGYRIRLESARRISKNGPRNTISEPKVFVYGNNTIMQQLFSSFTVKEPTVLLPNLPQNMELPMGSILIAPYELRRQVTIYLTARRPPIYCILFGIDLLPDGVVNLPQIELISQNPEHVKQYLFSKGVSIVLSAPQSMPSQHNHPSVSPVSQQGVQLQQQAGLVSSKSVKFVAEHTRKSSESSNYWVGGQLDPLVVSRQVEYSSATKAAAAPTAQSPQTRASGVIREWTVRKKPNASTFVLYPSELDHPGDLQGSTKSYPTPAKEFPVFRESPYHEHPQTPNFIAGSIPPQTASAEEIEDQVHPLHQSTSQFNSLYNTSMINSNPSLKIASNQSLLNNNKHAVLHRALFSPEEESARPIKRKVINLAEVHKTSEMSSPDANTKKRILTGGRRQQRFTLTKANTAQMRHLNTAAAAMKVSSPSNTMSASQNDPNFSALNEQSNYGSLNNSSASNAILIQENSIPFKKKRPLAREVTSEAASEPASEIDLKPSENILDESATKPVQQEPHQPAETVPYRVDYKIPVGVANIAPAAQLQGQEQEDVKVNPRLSSPKAMSAGYYSAANYIISEEVNENESLLFDKNMIEATQPKGMYRKSRPTYQYSDEKRPYKNSRPSRANILEVSHEDASSMNSFQQEPRPNTHLISPTPSHGSEQTPSNNSADEMNLVNIITSKGLSSEQFQPENGTNIYSIQNSHSNDSENNKPSSHNEENRGEVERRKSPISIEAESKQSKTSEFPKNSYCSVSQSNPQSAMEYGLPPNLRKSEKSPLAIHFTEKNSTIRLPVLFLLSKSLEELRPKIEALATDRDKIQVYSRSHQLKKISYPDYSVVFLFPKEDDKLPEVLQPNLYIIHLVRPEKQYLSHQLFVRDMRQLSGLIGNVIVDPHTSRNKISSHISANNCDWSRAQENIRKYSSRLKVLFPGSQIELEQGIYKKLTDQVVPVKYFDSTTLTDRAKHFRKDKLAIVLVSSMLRSIRDIRTVAKNVKFIVLERNGRSISRQEDVKFVQDIHQVLQLLEKFSQP